MSHLLYHRSKDQYFIRPASPALPELASWVFDPLALHEEGILTRTAYGRAAVWFFEYEGHRLVLRHYWRGGFVARITKDRFIWQGLNRTRPWMEMETLLKLREVGVPVPEPVAARISKDSHQLLYSADIITTEIPDALPLPDVISSGQTSHHENQLLFSVGVVLARLHAAGARHRDLNVRNILIDSSDEVSVIDWDKGSVCPKAKGEHRQFAKQSLARLERSIRKEPLFKDSHREIYAQILNGYQSIR